MGGLWALPQVCRSAPLIHCHLAIRMIWQGWLFGIHRTNLPCSGQMFYWFANYSHEIVLCVSTWKTEITGISLFLGGYTSPWTCFHRLSFPVITQHHTTTPGQDWKLHFWQWVHSWVRTRYSPAQLGIYIYFLTTKFMPYATLVRWNLQ